MNFFQITRCLSFCQSDCPEVRYDDPPFVVFCTLLHSLSLACSVLDHCCHCCARALEALEHIFVLATWSNCHWNNPSAFARSISMQQDRLDSETLMRHDTQKKKPFFHKFCIQPSRLLRNFERFQTLISGHNGTGGGFCSFPQMGIFLSWVF